MSDPKLKEVMAEVRAVLRKHDVAGYMILASPIASEFGLEIDPSWSAVRWEDKNTGKLRIKASTKELGQDAAHKLVDNTVHMIFAMGDLCNHGFQQFTSIARLLRQHVEIEILGETKIVPHTEH